MKVGTIWVNCLAVTSDIQLVLSVAKKKNRGQNLLNFKNIKYNPEAEILKKNKVRRIFVNTLHMIIYSLT